MSKIIQATKLAASIDSNPNAVWSILLRNGQELLAKIKVIKPHDPDMGISTFRLSSARVIEHINVPMQSAQGLGINSVVKTRPLMITSLGGADDLPLNMEDIWMLTESNKESRDNYVRETTGIALS